MTDPQKQSSAPTDEPRAYTAEEMRALFLSHVQATVGHWAPISGPGGARTAAEGVAFSILVALDGGAGGLPAFDLVPSPHPDDEAWHRREGENWWPEGVVINECQLHELLWREER
jgi:hypothetical protein